MTIVKQVNYIEANYGVCAALTSKEGVVTVGQIQIDVENVCLRVNTGSRREFLSAIETLQKAAVAARKVLSEYDKDNPGRDINSVDKL